ncbi:MAG: hypothetical protein ACLUQ6_10870 [Alistipes onderdonkii]
MVHGRCRGQGLPDIRTTHFDLTIPRLTSTAESIDALAAGIGGRALSDKLVAILGNSGDIDVNARFRGLLSSFDMRVGAKTDVGGIDCNLQMSPLRGGAAASGRCGRAQPQAGRTTRPPRPAGQRHAHGFRRRRRRAGVTDANVVGNVTQLGFNGYVYDSLRLDGRLRNREFDGRITARDPNLDFDFLGMVDFNDSVPRYDFTMDLRRADLARLHVNRRDSVSELSAHIVAKAGGRSLDDLNGRIQVTDVLYRYNDKQLTSKSMTVTGENSARSKLVELRSDFADATFRSKTSYREVFRYLRASAWKYLPLLRHGDEESGPRASGMAVANDFSLLLGRRPPYRPDRRRHLARPAGGRRLVAATAFQPRERPAFAQGDFGIYRTQAYAGHAAQRQRFEPGRLAHGLRFGRRPLCGYAPPAGAFAHGRRQAGARAALGRLQRYAAQGIRTGGRPGRRRRRARAQRPRRRPAHPAVAHHPRLEDLADFRPQDTA